MDWKKLLSELREVGYTQERIGEHCGVAQTTVSDLARGVTKQPSFDVGFKLISLHQQKCGAKRARSRAVA